MSEIDAEVLKSLCCPKSQQPLSEADAAVLADMNQRIAAGVAKTRGGRVITENVARALVRKDARIAYPVRDGILIALVDDAIVL
jgi:uncharacterized protein YbaR (Trm112 family)